MPFPVPSLVPFPAPCLAGERVPVLRASWVPVVPGSCLPREEEAPGIHPVSEPEIDRVPAVPVGLQRHRLREVEGVLLLHCHSHSGKEKKVRTMLRRQTRVQSRIFQPNIHANRQDNTAAQRWIRRCKDCKNAFILVPSVICGLKPFLRIDCIL